MPHPPIAALRSAFTASAKPGSEDWPTLADFTAFAAAGRACGRAPLIGLPGWTCDDAARVLALAELAARTPECDLSAHLRTLYWRGDAHERRAVLRALPYLAVSERDPALAGALVEDALRTGDPQLIAAARFAEVVAGPEPAESARSDASQGAQGSDGSDRAVVQPRRAERSEQAEQSVQPVQPG
ncbi:EboA domain-containing protein [Embleya sp. NPDC127516]|uniref:EboA domain-containing protein n=1 Tax=Embleya sp. NPDC127516 TaxID=3363990 RepID=UPI00381607C4